MRVKPSLILKYVVYSPIYFFYPARYKRTVWLIGSGRSGTTWISSLINLRGNYRELFEPFHPIIYELKLAGFRKHLFLAKESKKRVFRFLGNKILKGNFYHPRVEESSLFINKLDKDILIVKDIYANLMAHQISMNNSNVKHILLIRNPFAVALSVRNKKKLGLDDRPQ